MTIAFPDRVKGGAHDTAHRKVVLPLLLDELEAAGVRPEDTRLVCAIGLHRKNHRHEFEDYLGREVLDRLPADNVVNHDAEDPDGMVDLGLSDLGDPVQVNSAVVESDLTVLVGHAAGNPYGGFSGGYKMPATGPDVVALDRLAPRAALAVPRRLRAGLGAQPVPRPADLDRAGDGGADAAAVLQRRRRARLAVTPARRARGADPGRRAGDLAAGRRAHRPRGHGRACRRAAGRDPAQLPLRAGHGLQPDPDDAGRRFLAHPRQARPGRRVRS